MIFVIKQNIYYLDGHDVPDIKKIKSTDEQIEMTL